MNNIFVQQPVIDRLVFLLPYDIDPRTNEQHFKRVQRRVERLDSNLCETAHVRGSRYYLRFRILLPSDHKVLVQMGAFDHRRNKGGIRIELNPSRLKDGDVSTLIKTLRTVLGLKKERLQELFAESVVNKLHVAVDCYGVDLRRLLVAFQHTDKLTVFGKRIGKDGRIEGYNFGAQSSNYQAAVYDKKTERVHRAVESLLRAGRSADIALKANKVTQFYDARGVSERLRVEVRGQKMRGTPLCKIKTLTNRFAWFKFADLDAEGSTLPPVLQQAFISMCHDIGVKTALAQFKGTKQVRKINKFWRSRQTTWWKPQQMWAQVESRLRATKLFPAEAFQDQSATTP